MARRGRRLRHPSRASTPRVSCTEDDDMRSPWRSLDVVEVDQRRDVSTEVLVLAVISTVWPTTAAAVWAMLVGARPRRLLAIYLLAGLPTWGRAHRQALLTAGFGGVGIWLVATGVSDLT
jgi:hypothetical protein